jgi:hypothetical protein
MRSPLRPSFLLALTKALKLWPSDFAGWLACFCHFGQDLTISDYNVPLAVLGRTSRIQAVQGATHMNSADAKQCSEFGLCKMEI